MGNKESFPQALVEKISERKFHLVYRSSICSSKLEGGLDIKFIRGMNEALLGKWLWRLGDKSEGLWKKILMAKYGNQRDGCETKDNRYRLSPFWKGIITVMEEFMKKISSIKFVRERRSSFGKIRG